MADLHKRAAEDFQKILGRDNRPCIFYPPSPDPAWAPINGQVTRIDANIDPQTGQQVIGPKFVITVSFLDLVSSVVPTTGWEIDTEDTEGENMRVRIIEPPRRDRTLGFLTFITQAYVQEV